MNISVFVGLLLVFTLSLGWFTISYQDGKNEGLRERRAQALVLGDIGRSPRMRNHATSLARHNIAVDLIGYIGTMPV